MPGAYALFPPIWLTRSERFVNPPSAAKNGTWVVPAWVMSGPSPETAALRMRSNWTSQRTSCTSTFTPVLAVNGAIILSRSSFGLGEFGIVQSVRVVPFSSCGSFAAWLLAAGVELELLLSSPPQATMAAGASTNAIADATTASLLRTRVFLLRVDKNGFGTAAGTAALCRRRSVHLLARGRGRGAADHELDREPEQRVATGVAGDSRDERVACRCAEAELVLAHRGERGIDVGSKLDVVEADNRDVLGHAQAGLGDGAHSADRHHVGRREDRGGAIFELEEPGGLFAARLGVEVSVGDVLVAVGETERLRGGTVAAQAVDPRSRLEHPGDRG